MKIVYVVQYYPPHTGGLEKVAYKQAVSAAEAGHTVSVVTFALPGSPKGASVEEGVTVYRVPGNHFFDTHFGIPFCIGGPSLVRTIFKLAHDADVIHLHDVFYLSSLVGYLAARTYQKPLMLTQHVGLVPHSSRPVMWAERLVYALWGVRIFRASTHILTYQNVVRDFLLTHMVLPERIVSLQNGIEVDAFHPISADEKRARRATLGLPVDKPLVLFVGRLVPKKGFKELFDARSEKDYDIVFVGPGDVPAEWRATAGVHVLGGRSQEEVRYLMPAMDIFAAPSKGETFTLVMQEAMACGLPIVVADLPGYAAYAIDRTRFVLCERTGDALRSALRRIAADPSLRNAMGAYARAYATTWFDWDKNVQASLALYKSLDSSVATGDTTGNSCVQNIPWKNV